MNKELLTFERAQKMLGRRRFKKLTNQCRLYPGEGGRSILLKATSYHRSSGLKDKKVHEPPIAILYPHNVAVLNSSTQQHVAYSIYGRYFHLMAFKRVDRRSSVQIWWFSKAVPRAEAKPFGDGMQFDILNGIAITEPPVEKRRTLDLKAAKPLRDQIAAWDKFARTYFALLEWTPRHYDILKKATQQQRDAGFPPLGEEPSEEGLFRVVTTVRTYWSWWRFDPSRNSHIEPAELAKDLRGRWRTAFEHWKERIYKEHGAYSWQPVDKEAA